MFVTPSQMRVSKRAELRRGPQVPPDLVERVDDAGVQHVGDVPSSSSHVPNWNGSPAVGSCWNISARFDA